MSKIKFDVIVGSKGKDGDNQPPPDLTDKEIGEAMQGLAIELQRGVHEQLTANGTFTAVETERILMAFNVACRSMSTAELYRYGINKELSPKFRAGSVELINYGMQLDNALKTSAEQMVKERRLTKQSQDGIAEEGIGG